jgi:glutamate-ammonia-ligase adenylyltransferase
LLETGVWSQAEHDELSQALTFLQALQQVQRMAHDDVTASQDLSNALKDRLCRATACDGFEQLSDRLEAVAARVTDIFQKKIGSLATET